MTEKQKLISAEYMMPGVFEDMLEKRQVKKLLPTNQTNSGDPFNFAQGDVVYIVTNVTKAFDMFSNSKFKEKADFENLRCAKRQFYNFDNATKLYTFLTVKKPLSRVNIIGLQLPEITVDNIIKQYTLYVDATKPADTTNTVVSINPVIAPIVAVPLPSPTVGGRRTRKRRSKKSKKSRRPRKSRKSRR